jgi:hypothetical protein
MEEWRVVSEMEEKVITEVIEQLAVLEPAAEDAPQPVHHAFAHFQRRLQQPSRQRPSRLGQPFNSKGSLEMSKRKGWAVALASVLILAVLFSFPSVRAAASDFLGLFRVQKFAPISISPERIELLQQLADQGMAPGEFEVNNEPGAETPVSSLAEASAQLGIPVRTVTTLGAPGEIYLVDGGDGHLRVDLEGARAIMEAVGADPLLLPDSLDGARVNVVIFNAVRQVWGDGTELNQSESPYAEYPDDLDPTVLGEALLQVLGVAPESAGSIARSIDWTATFLLPIPQSVGTFSEVTVDGTNGVAMQSLNGEGNALVWEKEGVIYLLNGDKSIDELLSLANSLE